jgi:hypothetical protein
MLARTVWFSLLLFAVVDLAARFLVPVQSVAFRAWEAVNIFPTSQGAFTPNFVYDRVAFGDLANMARRPDLREYRREVFTTDSFGFRSTPGSSVPAKALFFGDSFGAGAGLSDDETVPARLNRLGLGPVYNAAGVTSWPQIEQLLARNRISEGWILWQISERFPLPQSYIRSSSRANRLVGDLFGEDSPWYRRFQVAGRLSQTLPGYSPMGIALRRWFAPFHDGFVLPKVPTPRIQYRELINGQNMLFLTSEIANFASPSRADIRSLVELDERARARGVRFAVLLVPDKYSVYHSLVAADKPAEPTRSYLAMMKEDLAAKGITAVDLTAPLRKAAGELAPLKKLVYYRDDTHWNAAGADLAARELAQELASRLAARPAKN